jgi:hypothetical protein
VIAAAEGKRTGCTTGGSAAEWSPDASTLKLSEPKLGSVATVDARCGNRHGLPDPTNRIWAGVSWAPDGRLVVPAAMGDWQPLCTLEGSEGADTIAGTDGDDVICGLASDDLIEGRGGHDVIYGGPGNDTLTGGPGKDWLFGSDGNDTLLTNDGEQDIANGGPGNNTATADTDDDVVLAESPARR